MTCENCICDVAIPVLRYFISGEHFFQQYNDKLHWSGDDDVRFVLDKCTNLNVYSISPLQQQSTDIYCTPLGHSILIPSQLVFAIGIFKLFLEEI
jgi:hypothetical protein